MLDFTQNTYQECKVLMTYSLRQDQRSQKYEKILCARLETELCTLDEKSYRVQVACKVHGQKQLDIFDVGEETPLRERIESKRSMTYRSDNTENMKVSISRHFRKVLLVNQHENYLLEEDETKEMQEHMGKEH